MSYSGVAGEEAGKERKAGNPIGLSMQRDAAGGATGSMNAADQA